jgi:hypothetical protein
MIPPFYSDFGLRTSFGFRVSRRPSFFTLHFTLFIPIPPLGVYTRYTRYNPHKH